MVLNQPKNYIDFFLSFPSNVVISKNENNQWFEFIHIFVKQVKKLENLYKIAKMSLKKMEYYGLVGLKNYLKLRLN